MWEQIDMYFLGKPYKILSIINLTCSRQLKQNIKYKNIDNEAQYFLCEKPLQIVKIKNHEV